MFEQSEKPSRPNRILDELCTAMLEIDYEREQEKQEEDPASQRDNERWAREFIAKHCVSSSPE